MRYIVHVEVEVSDPTAVLAEAKRRLVTDGVDAKDPNMPTTVNEALRLLVDPGQGPKGTVILDSSCSEANRPTDLVYELVSELRAAHELLTEYADYAERMREHGRGFQPVDRYGRHVAAVIGGARAALQQAAREQPDAIELAGNEKDALWRIVQAINGEQWSGAHVAALETLGYVKREGKTVTATALGIEATADESKFPRQD